MDTLPNELLHKIFVRLPLNDRVRINRVCHKWRRIFRDKILWPVVDIQPKQGLNRTVVKIVKSIGSDQTSVFRITSFAPDERPSKSYRNPLTLLTWHKIYQTCQNLKELYFKFVDLENFYEEMIPKTVKRIYMIECRNVVCDLEKNSSLELLDVQGHEDADAAMESLPYSLKYLGVRTVFNWSWCLIGCSRLTHLDISRNGILLNMDLFDFKALDLLQELDVSFNTICPKFGVGSTDQRFDDFLNGLPTSLKKMRVCELEIYDNPDHKFWNESTWFDVSRLSDRGINVIGCTSHFQCPLLPIIPSPTLH